MTSRQIDLSPIGGRRIGRRRAAWRVVLLAAACALLGAGALEWANRAHLREQLRIPLSEIDTAALRDLTTAIAATKLDPWHIAERFEAVAEKHPDSPVAPYALWSAHIGAFEDEERIRLALEAAEIATPENPRYAIYVDTASWQLKRAGRQHEAIALVEQALERAGPDHRERLESALERAKRGNAVDGD